MDIVATVGGDEIMALSDLIPNEKNFGHFENVEMFLDYIKSDVMHCRNSEKKIFIGGDVVLIKGARANKLELIIDYL